jgi:hypothetical protein
MMRMTAFNSRNRLTAFAPFTHFDIHNETELRCELCKQWGGSDEDRSNDSKGIAIVDDIGGRRFPTT